VRRLQALYRDDAAKVEVYLARYGLELTPQRIQECAALEGTKDPLLASSARCSVCGQEIPYWIVKSGTQRIEMNEFHIPCSAAGTQGHFSVNPIIYEVIVCAGCLFASALRSDFGAATPASREKGLELSGPAKQRFTEARESRAARLEGAAPEALFLRPRDLDSVIVAYEIACDTDVWKLEHNMPGARLRLGADHLRVYTLLKMRGDDERAPLVLEEAHADLQAAYADSEDPNVGAPAAYLALAVSIRTGRSSDAAQYYQILRKLDSETPEGPGTRGVLRWCKMAGELWTSWRAGELG